MWTVALKGEPMTRECSDRIEISATPELVDWLKRTAETFGWPPEDAPLRLLYAACVFTETCWMERLTPDPSQ